AVGVVNLRSESARQPHYPVTGPALVVARLVTLAVRDCAVTVFYLPRERRVLVHGWCVLGTLGPNETTPFGLIPVLFGTFRDSYGETIRLAFLLSLFVYACFGLVE